MAESKAILRSYRQTPRKTRRVAVLIKGKKVSDAKNLLDYTIKRPALPIKKLLSSAVANAKSQGLAEESLFVKDIRVDNGGMFKRFRPASRGSAHPVKKRMSHLIVVVSTDAPKGKGRKSKSLKTKAKNQ